MQRNGTPQQEQEYASRVGQVMRAGSQFAQTFFFLFFFSRVYDLCLCPPALPHPSHFSCLRTLLGHEGEISSSSFNFTSDMVVSGSIDKTIKLFDVATGRCINTIEVHTDEILDVVFNSTGTTYVHTLHTGCGRDAGG